MYLDRELSFLFMHEVLTSDGSGVTKSLVTYGCSSVFVISTLDSTCIKNLHSFARSYVFTVNRYIIDACYYRIVFVLQRWQRRFFVLYDDGELAYSVDENVST